MEPKSHRIFSCLSWIALREQFADRNLLSFPVLPPTTLHIYWWTTLHNLKFIPTGVWQIITYLNRKWRLAYCPEIVWFILEQLRQKPFPAQHAWDTSVVTGNLGKDKTKSKAESCCWFCWKAINFKNSCEVYILHCLPKNHFMDTAFWYCLERILWLLLGEGKNPLFDVLQFDSGSFFITDSYLNMQMYGSQTSLTHPICIP